MLYSDQQILNFIRSHYTDFNGYTFPDLPVDEQKEFFVVRDIHEINEDNLNISKDIFVRGLQENRQTNSINISNICDSLNAESCDMGEAVYKELEKYNKVYTKAFIRNGSRWVDLKAFNLTCDKAKELINNKNPRILFNISKYTHILNTTLLNSANLRLSLVTLRSCLELMHTEIRKMNYDMIMSPVTTIVKGNEYETLVQTKYIDNFSLHEDIMFDHEFQVFGTIAGLAARKKRGEFGRVKPYYYQFKLIDLLTKDYGYLNLDIEVKEGNEGQVFVNGKQIAHKVLLKRKKITSNFASFSKFSAKLLSKKLPREASIYDYSNPIELATLSPAEVNDLLDSKEGMIVYQIDETLYDSYSIYDMINPQSSIVVEKGELFDAYCNLFGVAYNQKPRENSILLYPSHFLVFSKTLQSDQIQRIKLFDSMMHQHRNAILRAEQAEKAILELQKSNEHVIELNSSLQEKVKDRTRELEMANEARTNTFVNLAHETKTPLTLINNYLNQFIKRNGESEELGVIRNSLGKLTKDINNFFDLERINKGFYLFNHEQLSDFSKILKDNLILFKEYAITKGVEITEEIEDNLFVKADPDSINRIINNLIENAIKYSGKNGKVKVTLKLSADKIEFKVKDTGIGISPELHHKIFEPYFQINTEKRNFQGMGLGLSIVKKIIDGLDGEIGLRSDPDRAPGAELTVCLKCHEVQKNEVVSEFEVDNKAHLELQKLEVKDEILDDSKPFILVVEDNISLLNYMVKELKERYNVYFATSGSEALEKIKTITQLDLIVSDVMMDKGDGYDFCKSILTQKRFNHLPFIFITAKASSEDKIHGLSLGAIDYIFKPFLIEELIIKIDSVLNNLENQRNAIINQAYKALMNGKEPDPVPPANPCDKFEGNCSKFNLTEREKEVTLLIAKGQIYTEIADNLNISKYTVKKHIENIFQKVGVNNKIELLNKLEASQPDSQD